MIDAKGVGLVTSIERIVEFVFMQALAYPNAELEDDDMGCSLIKSQLLPGLRSFCSALRVCEQVCENTNVFDDGKTLFLKVNNPNEVQELATNKEFCGELEERVLNWIKDVAKVLMESQQLRKENDTSGPQDELEYWKKRAAQFSQLLSHLEVSTYGLQCTHNAEYLLIRCASIRINLMTMTMVMVTMKNGKKVQHFH